MFISRIHSVSNSVHDRLEGAEQCFQLDGEKKGLSADEVKYHFIVAKPLCVTWLNCTHIMYVKQMSVILI